jgi:hypothetical protein
MLLLIARDLARLESLAKRLILRCYSRTAVPVLSDTTQTRRPMMEI